MPSAGVTKRTQFPELLVLLVVALLGGVFTWAIFDFRPGDDPGTVTLPITFFAEMPPGLDDSCTVRLRSVDIVSDGRGFFLARSPWAQGDEVPGEPSVVPGAGGHRICTVTMRMEVPDVLHYSLVVHDGGKYVVTRDDLDNPETLPLIPSSVWQSSDGTPVASPVATPAMN